MTDPYGKLEWCIGNADDFWCFDYEINDDDTVTLHAVINSETGSFIQDAEPPITVPEKDTVAKAQELTDKALEWCAENDIEHDQEGWNQSPCYFRRSVHCEIAGTGLAIRIPVKMKGLPVGEISWFSSQM
jgi:hypothetical protein